MAHTVPAMTELAAPAGWRTVDFLADLHLEPAQPATLDALRRYLDATPADAVFFLGDLFEVWVGDDAMAEPGSFEGQCCALLAAAAARRALFFMHGNRDFLVGAAFTRQTGVGLLADPTVLSFAGRRWLLSHGDALCLADRGYQDFRAQVRDAAWQRAFLARPLAERLAVAREIRGASEKSHMRRQFDGEMAADVDIAAATALLRAAGGKCLVHGHTHRPGSEAWPGGFERHVLTDWDLDTGSRAEVPRLDAGGFTRRPPASRAAAC